MDFRYHSARAEFFARSSLAVKRDIRGFTPQLSPILWRFAMRYFSLALLCAWFAVGCASRGDLDLLESQLRLQEDRLFALQRDLNAANAEIQSAHREADVLRDQLAERRDRPALQPEQSRAISQVTGVSLNKMFTGGLNRDDEPGDDLLNVLVTPHDEQADLVKLPGRMEIEVLDLSQTGTDRTIGRWQYDAAETAKHWHNGIAKGYQFRLPWQQQPQSEELILNVRYTTTDGRRFTTNRKVRIDPPASAVASAAPRQTESWQPPPRARVAAPAPLPRQVDASRFTMPAELQALESGDRKPTRVAAARPPQAAPVIDLTARPSTEGLVPLKVTEADGVRGVVPANNEVPQATGDSPAVDFQLDQLPSLPAEWANEQTRATGDLKPAAESTPRQEQRTIQEKRAQTRAEFEALFRDLTPRDPGDAKPN